jgi:hypothetical protein
MGDYKMHHLVALNLLETTTTFGGHTHVVIENVLPSKDNLDRD